MRETEQIRGRQSRWDRRNLRTVSTHVTTREAEALRRQRDDLQQEVLRLEHELAAKKEVIRGLEGQERRRSTAVESQWEALKGEITSLKRERELLGVGVGGGREA